MAKELTKKSTVKFDKILKTSKIEKEARKLAKEELVELKSHAIKKALKIKKYVRN